MGRKLAGLFTCAIVLCLATTALDACGDKFLRPGRSPRYRAYAAIHPATILFYAPHASQKQIDQYRAVLERSGHHTRAARSVEQLRQELADMPFDLVIAPLKDAAPVKTAVVGASSHPEILPVVGKLTRTMRATIESEYPHTLSDGTSDFEALAEIDHVMEARLGQRAPTPVH